MLRVIGLLFLCCLAVPAWAQQEGLLQTNDSVHGFLLRQHTLGRLPDAFLGAQPLSAYEAQRYLDTLASNTAVLSRVDRQLLSRFRGTAPGPGVVTVQRALPFAYSNGRNLISVREDDYGFEIDPLAYLAYGQAMQTDRDTQDGNVTIWQNTRGIRIGGHIGKHIFFETRLEENQRRDPQPVFFNDTAPRLGRTKFDNGIYDYFVATGVAGFRSNFFEVRFGRDRNRWGFGKNSLILSNFAPVYDQLQIRTTVWRFQYINLFTGFSTPTPDSIRFTPRRYGAFHRLEIALPGRLRAELFESIMFASSDTTGFRDSGFDITYLNPVIFLRAVESDRGSNDNALLGAGLSWIALPGLYLYGQLLIDELRLSEIGNQWWANKWGWLAGFHLSDMLIDNLSLRLEYARLRPYLYSHRTPSAAYIHYADFLGHPAGPNARDVSAFMEYQPIERLHVALALAYTQRGRNPDGENFGADPSITSNTRADSRGVVLLQGVRQDEILFEGRTGYELLPHFFLEAALRVQSINDDMTGQNRYVAPFLLMRWGLPFQSVRY